MDKVGVGSVITRSDGKRFVILSNNSKAEVPRDILVILAKNAQGIGLIGKRVGDYYYPSGLNGLTITNIQKFIPADAANRKERQKQEEFKIIRLLQKFKFEEAKKEFKKCETVYAYWFNTQYEKYYNLWRMKNYNEAISELSPMLKRYDFKKAQRVYIKKYSQAISHAEFMSLLNKYEREREITQTTAIREAQEDLYSLLSEYKFGEARKRYHEKYSRLIDKHWFDNERKHYKAEKLKDELLPLLREYKYTEAEEYFSHHSGEELLGKTWIKKTIASFEVKREKEEWSSLIEPALDSLRDFNFKEADEKAPVGYYEKYLDLKTQYVKKWFEVSVALDNETYRLDDEQARAVADMRQNIIVAARAGSGKTRTLVAKIVFLMAKYEIHYTELLVFVFNRNAMEEINQRLNRICVDGILLIDNDIIEDKKDDQKVAYTFHSFAMELVYDMCHEESKYGSVLVNDEKSKNPLRTRFIQEILKEIPKEKIYKFFRNEAIMNDSGENNKYDLYEIQRKQQYETLDGKVVRSRSEKIICDYLFEHGIEYRYENEIYTNGLEKYCVSENDKSWIKQKKSVKPDFYLPNKDGGGIFWEHWMFNGEESPRDIGDNLKKDYAEYIKTRDWKIKFYGKQWLSLNDARMGFANKRRMMEFLDCGSLMESYRPLGMGRKEFELQIHDALEKRGIHNELLPDQVLIEAVWAKQIKKFTRIVESFIDRAEQKYLGDLNRLESDIEMISCDTRTKSFLEISFECYSKYLSLLKRDAFGNSQLSSMRTELAEYEGYGIDFNILLHVASEIIKRDTDSNVKQIISNKKYILIDEYQDFSALFYELIDSIRSNRPDIKLFVVGDDWQAINRFAGSDVGYFMNFERYFPRGTARHLISTNYRCSKAVVEESFKVVQNALNESSEIRTRSNADSGKVSIGDPEDVFIDYVGYADNIYKKSLAIRLTNATTVRKIAAQYLKICAESIIKQYITSDGKLKNNILLLHRNNKFSFFLEQWQFLDALKYIIREKYKVSEAELNEKINMLTMHRAKGLESDVVIILEADEGVIPAVHQNTCLFELFGESEQNALDDQARLFYVAMTRARQDLYILHAKQNDAEQDGFVRYINNASKIDLNPGKSA